MKQEPMKKEISCMNTCSIIEYMISIRPGCTKRLLEGMVNTNRFLYEEDGKLEKVTLDYLMNSKNWVSNDLSLKLFENSRKILGGPHPLFYIGKNIFKKKITGYRGSALRIVGNIEYILKKSAKFNSRYNRTKKVTCVHFEPGYAIIRQKYHKNVNIHQDICDFNRGGLVGFLSYVASQPKLEEKKCAMKGDEYCEYHFSWKPRNFFQRIYDLTLGKYHYLKEVKEALEKKDDENEDLIFNLEKKVKERTEQLHETNLRLKRAYKKLKDLSERRVKYLAEASHEIRNPLMVMKGNIDMLRDLNLDNKEKLETLELVEDNLNKVDKLVAGCLTLAAKDLGIQLVKREINLNDLVCDTCKRIKPLIKNKDLKIIPQLDSTVKILGSKEKISRLLNNLIDNAIKYTPKGKVFISLKKSDKNAVIEVADTGIGIPKEYHDKIFERFFRADKEYSRKLGGTGLGLAICKWIAEAHGGKIGVESEPGRGSKFIVTLPYQS